MTPKLHGVVVAVTRAGAEDDPLVAALQREGARVVSWPTLSLEASGDPEALRAALAELASYRWIVFTSPRAVEAVARVSGPPESERPRTAAVGHATAEALEEAGWRVDLVGGGAGAEDLARALDAADDLQDARILFPAGDRARDVLERALESSGARVSRIEAYRTRLRPPPPARVREDLTRGVDVVAFASPSAVQALDECLDGALASALSGSGAAAIGPTTLSALTERGVTGAEMAPDTSIEGLVEACALARPRTTSA